MISSVIRTIAASCRTSPRSSPSPPESSSNSSSGTPIPKVVLVLVGFDERWPSYDILLRRAKGRDFRLVMARLQKYDDGTPNISLSDKIHRQDVVWVVGTSHDLVEMYTIVHFVTSLTSSVNTVYTYVPHLRDDKSSREARADAVNNRVRQRVEIPTAPYVVEMIGQGSGCTSNLILEPHTLQIASAPKVSAHDLMTAMVRFVVSSINIGIGNKIGFVFPDAGAKSRYGDPLFLMGHTTQAACDKVRENATTTRTTFSVDPIVQAELEEKEAIILFDDLISSGGTIVQALDKVRKSLNNKKIKYYLAAVHFDPTAGAIARFDALLADGSLAGIFVSDSNPRGVQALMASRCSPGGAGVGIKVFPIGEEIAKIIS